MKKKGFTLIELLAVIVMIIIIVGLGAPTLINVLKNNKEKALTKTIEIIESAARNYAIDYGESAGNIICISTLCSKEYLSCPINNIVTEIVMDGCVIVTKDANNIKSYNYDSNITEITMVNLTIDLDGGSIEIDPTDSYCVGSNITLSTPTKPNSTFAGWDIESGNSTISGNNLIIGTENTIIKALWVKIVTEYAYTGNVQEFIVPKDGTYKIELWGAQGGGTSTVPGGKGAYTSGNIMLNKNLTLYFYVGSSSTLSVDSYNGGGNANNSHYPSYDGGGATDVRLTSGVWDNSASLISRIMVAAGGGGAEMYIGGGAGGYGGALLGQNGGYTGNIKKYTPPTGGTQVIGGNRDTANAYPGKNGSFGKGGDGDLSYGGGGGGSGWYGGGGGSNDYHVSSGGGGSSYISGYTGCVAVTSEGNPKPGCANETTDNSCSIHYSGKVFTGSTMIAGNASMPTHDGTSTMTGNNGDGYAKITYIGNE